MSAAATLALLAWPLCVLALLVLLGPRRGAPLSYLIGWLFLPLLTIDFPGLPPYGKFTATGLSLLVFIPLLDSGSLARFRLRWFDAPIMIWCLSPMFSSLANGLGLWDGVTSVFAQVVFWGLPYLVGRLYLGRGEDVLFLCKAFVVGALIYLPLCVWEARMSPQLHAALYGVRGRVSWETHAAGPFKYAPSVFMNSAFEVTVMLGSACMIAFQSWRTRSPRLTMLGNGLAFGLLAFGFLIGRKWSGIGESALGLAALLIAQKGALRLALVTVAVVPLLYMVLFASGIWQGDNVIEAVQGHSARRADSLALRLNNDKLLIEKARRRPIFGWGGWGRSRIHDDFGEDVSTTDSMWMITLGTKGIVGLGSLILMFVLPAILAARSFRPTDLLRPPYAGVLPLALILLLQLIDILFNAFPNSIYPMIAGCLGSTCLYARARARHPVRVRAAS